MTVIVAYIDVISPYAYLGQHRLRQIAAARGATIEWRAIDLRRAKAETGNTAPPTVAMPNKYAFALKDFDRWAAIYGVPFKEIAHPNGRRFNTGLLYAIDRGQADAYVEAVFHHFWGIGGAPDDPDFLDALIADLGWDAATFNAFIDSPEAAAREQAVFVQACTDRVFGVPTFVIDDELWWGNDRLFMVDNFLATRAVGAAA